MKGSNGSGFRTKGMNPEVRIRNVLTPILWRRKYLPCLIGRNVKQECDYAGKYVENLAGAALVLCG
jgi:hypothetical protein